MFHKKKDLKKDSLVLCFINNVSVYKAVNIINITEKTPGTIKSICQLPNFNIRPPIKGERTAAATPILCIKARTLSLNLP